MKKSTIRSVILAAVGFPLGCMLGWSLGLTGREQGLLGLVGSLGLTHLGRLAHGFLEKRARARLNDVEKYEARLAAAWNADLIAKGFDIIGDEGRDDIGTRDAFFVGDLHVTARFLWWPSMSLFDDPSSTCVGCGQTREFVDIEVMVQDRSSGRVVKRWLARVCQKCGRVHSASEHGAAAFGRELKEGENFIEWLNLVAAARTARPERASTSAQDDAARPVRQSALAATAR